MLIWFGEREKEAFGEGEDRVSKSAQANGAIALAGRAGMAASAGIARSAVAARGSYAEDGAAAEVGVEGLVASGVLANASAAEVAERVSARRADYCVAAVAARVRHVVAACGAPRGRACEQSESSGFAIVATGVRVGERTRNGR